jgi:hypothetical protein
LLVEGPIQQFLIERLADLDGLAVLLGHEQPAQRALAATILEQSAERREAMDSALAQAIEVERAITRLWMARFGADAGPTGTGLASPLRGAVPQASPTTIDPGVVPEDWMARLEALSPRDPSAYLDLAEEIADANDDAGLREVAAQLFGLAGALDPQGLGRSASLALADMEGDDLPRRRLLALAAILGRGRPLDAIDSPAGPGELSGEAALAVSEAFSHFRQGRGSRALALLEADGAMRAFLMCERAVPNGTARFLEDCKHYQGNRRPQLAPGDVTDMLWLESALLAGADRSWSGELLLTRGQPLIEVNPDRLDRAFGVDASRPCWRDGRWVPCP